MKYCDMTPTPDQYRFLLETIIKDSTKKDDRQWAKTELSRVQNVVKWSK